MDLAKENGGQMMARNLNTPEKPTLNFERPASAERDEKAIARKTEKRPELVDKDEHLASKEIEDAAREMPRPSVLPAAKTKGRVAIEKVLAEGLQDVYSKMSAGQKENFKKLGEETSVKIEEMLKRNKIKARKMLALISRWLATIPGVNDFYLEQEAKIKTDEILKLREDLKLRGEI